LIILTATNAEIKKSHQINSNKKRQKCSTSLDIEYTPMGAMETEKPE